MPNSYFRFKQFTIHQDRCSMKVCTDSCMLGAWTVSRLSNAQRVLDIGAGTGLLSLMLAQKSPACVDAIELDEAASGQAVENITATSWKDRINLINADVRSHRFSYKYDFIITNPPFFETDLLSSSSAKNKSRHSQTLTLEELLSVIRRNLRATGAFSILLPFHRTAYFENLARSNNFFLLEKLHVRQTPGHAPFRSILLFSFKEVTSVNPRELTIRDEEGRETTGLLDLLKDYYLR